MKKEIPSLDGIRAVAVMIVLVSHAGLGHIVPGGFGVTAFFFLSGYLITTLFIREQNKHGSIDLPAFYLRRLTRLSPPLLITLIIAYGGVALSVFNGGLTFSTIASQALYFFNYFSLYGPSTAPGAAGSGVLWSLAVEEHFYLLYPPLFVILARLKTNQARLALLSALLILNLLWRFVLVFQLNASSDHLYLASDARFDSILYGCFLAALAWDGTADRYFPKKLLGIACVSAAALAVILFTFLYRDQIFRDTVRYSLQGLALIPLFYYAVYRPELPHHRLLNTYPFMMIGAYSYSIYLIHHIVIKWLQKFDLFYGNFPATFLGSFAISVVYGAIMYRFVDEPMAVIRKRLRGH